MSDPIATKTTPAGRTSDGDPAARPPVFRQRPLLGIAIFAAVMLLIAANVHSRYGQGLLTNWTLLSIASVGFYFVFGLSGQFAFSQAAFYGIGAYTSAWVTKGTYDPETGSFAGGGGFLLGLVVTIVVASVVAFVFAWAVRRTNQFYFAITTLALSFMATTIFRNWTSFSEGGEVSNIPRIHLFGFTVETSFQRFAFLLGALVVVLVLIALIERSPMGRELIAIRDNETVAATLGIRTRRLRYFAFVLGSVIAAVAGGLYANTARALTIDTFGIGLGIDIFLVVLLGGIGSKWGAVLGAAFVVWVPTRLGFVGSHQEMVYGALLIVILVFAPKGLIGIVQSGVTRLRGIRTAATDTGTIDHG